jgi:hypothetical protein
MARSAPSWNGLALPVPLVDQLGDVRCSQAGGLVVARWAAKNALAGFGDMVLFEGDQRAHGRSSTSSS